MNTLRKISIQEVIKAAEDKGSHWFDSSAKRFFKSRWADTAYIDDNLNVSFFVSSEQFEMMPTSTSGYRIDPRKYTIRAVHMATGDFLSEKSWVAQGEGQPSKELYCPFLEFQRYGTSREATKDILKTDWSKLKDWLQ
jgi:hypothetical protein